MYLVCHRHTRISSPWERRGNGRRALTRTSATLYALSSLSLPHWDATVQGRGGTGKDGEIGAFSPSPGGGTSLPPLLIPLLWLPKGIRGLFHIAPAQATEDERQRRSAAWRVTGSTCAEWL